MKQIPLTQGQFALVDDEDFERINAHKWHAYRDQHTWYARTNEARCAGKQRTVMMHRLLLRAPPLSKIDHIDGNGLHNWKANLRVVTDRQNAQNLHMARSCSLPGVSWIASRGRFLSQIHVRQTTHNLGRYLTAEEAYAAYYSACLQLGESVELLPLPTCQIKHRLLPKALR